MALSVAVSRAGRWQAGRSVDRAAADLEARLGPGAARVVRAVPGDALRAGGAVVVSSQAAIGAARATQRAAQAAHRAGRATHSTARTVGRARQTARSRLSELSAEWHHLTDLEQRQLKADYLRHVSGDDHAAFETLLDVRAAPDPGPLPRTPDPVPGGRRRFRPPLAAPPVNRAQRTYRRARKPWD